ncbi:MAG: hypothetical protein V4582_06740 [Pseudomonadota bacterium]
MITRQIAVPYPRSLRTQGLRRAILLMLASWPWPRSGMAAMFVFVASLAIACTSPAGAELSGLDARQVCKLRAAALGDDGALDTLRRSARLGNIAAMRALGSVLIGNVDYALSLEGMQFAEQAAARGDAGAQSVLAHAYRDGRATLNNVPDLVRAQTWFELAAEPRAAGARGEQACTGQ